MSTPIPDWEEAHARSVNALRQVREEPEPFRKVIVTAQQGTVFIRWNKTTLQLREFSCGRGCKTTSTTARLLYIAGFGELDVLEGLLTLSDGLQATRNREGVVRIEAYAAYVAPPLA
ncbi:hypothetical protein PV379_00675 [Streptomyces caniscabiei]|uniref:hypothetical protein n=1 Tax=Streptomyces caniscabiei TaxID=2746961 RepID=UPI0029BE6B9C|nr:hypothetical protein [Streptomyces caniscabiei]MDX2775870.1 hypothetical protein [Streptomyces caniscabiei]